MSLFCRRWASSWVRSSAGKSLRATRVIGTSATSPIGREVVGDLEGELAVERGRGGHADVVQEQGVAVGRRARDPAGPDGAAGAADVLHHHLLAQRLRHPLGHQAGDRIGGPTGGERHHDGDGFPGKVLGPRPGPRAASRRRRAPPSQGRKRRVRWGLHGRPPCRQRPLASWKSKRQTPIPERPSPPGIPVGRRRSLRAGVAVDAIRVGVVTSTPAFPCPHASHDGWLPAFSVGGLDAPCLARMGLGRCLASLAVAACGGSRKRVSLLEIVPEPAGDNCERGGQAIRAGMDDDRDGLLSDWEVDSLTYSCRGRSARHGRAGAERGPGPSPTRTSCGAVRPRGPTVARAGRGPPGPPGPPGGPDRGRRASARSSIFRRATRRQLQQRRHQGGERRRRRRRRRARPVGGQPDPLPVPARDRPRWWASAWWGGTPRPTGPAAETVAAAPDGQTVVYSNGINNTVEFLDISDPARAPPHRRRRRPQHRRERPAPARSPRWRSPPTADTRWPPCWTPATRRVANPGALAFIDLRRTRARGWWPGSRWAWAPTASA